MAAINLSIAITSILLRAASRGGLADGIGDAAFGLTSLRQLVSGGSGGSKELAKAVERRIAEAVRIRYQLADKASLASASRDVSALLGGTDAEIEELVVDAVADPGALMARLMPPELPSGTVDEPALLRRQIVIGLLELSIKTINEVARGSASFHFAAQRRGLSQTVKISQDTEWIRHFLDGRASSEEIIDYLELRIADWERTAITHKAMSTLERRLKLVDLAEPSRATAEFSETSALADQALLVVLGAPGSGKSWLAHRYARSAARAAVTSLRDGAELGDVEIPILTTWDRWAKTPGEMRTSLVNAAFSPDLGLSDLGSEETIQRLMRTLMDAPRLLVVLDSLDEAADLAQQRSRVPGLISLALAGWRTIITSRPSAWWATKLDPAPPEIRTVELRSLEYPTDVHAFIDAWFADDSIRGRQLKHQIGNRQNLQQTSTIPLLLTFYCLLSEGKEGASRPLPGTRRELYDRLVRRLLRGSWSAAAPGADQAPDLDSCMEELAAWGALISRKVDPTTGLGAWGEDFLQPSLRSQGSNRRALDHVAPKMLEDPDGRIVRRFIHRTILEHFVAEHIASLDSQSAAEALQPHLWFDEDWRRAAGAAVAAHNSRRRGELLEILSILVSQDTLSPLKQAANTEIDYLLLCIAEESQPHEWDPPHRELIMECRLRCTAAFPNRVARSNHWSPSDNDTVTRLLHAVALNPRRAVRQLSTLTDLDIDPEDRDRVLKALMDTLPSQDLSDMPRFVNALELLGGGEDERLTLLRRLTYLLALEDEEGFGQAIVALRGLVKDATDRGFVRKVVIAQIPSHTSLSLELLLSSLHWLSKTDAERGEVLQFLVPFLSTCGDDAVLPVFWTLSTLFPGGDMLWAPNDRVLAVAADSSPGDVLRFASALMRVGARKDGKEKAKNLLLQKFDEAVQAGRASGFVSAISLLGMTNVDRAALRAKVESHLPNLEPTGLSRWGEDQTPALRDAAVSLKRLNTPDDKLEQIVERLLGSLRGANEWELSDLTMLLLELPKTVTQKVALRRILLWKMESLARSRAHVLPELVLLASSLSLTRTERTQARQALLSAVARIEAADVPDLLLAMSAVTRGAEERREARAALLASLPQTLPSWSFNPNSLPVDAGFSYVLLAREALRTGLDVGEVRSARASVTLLRALSSADEWIDWLTTG